MKKRKEKEPVSKQSLKRKNEILDGITRSIEEVKLIRQGKLKPQSLQNFLKSLPD